MINTKDMAQLEMLVFGAALLAIATRKDTGAGASATSKDVTKEARNLARAFVDGATKIAADVTPSDTRPGRY